MPSMYEIYESSSTQYDELVSREDHEGNLNKYLESKIAQCSTVIEFGAGTGRVTAQYIDFVSSVHLCDCSSHMLKKAEINLRSHIGKIRFSIVDNSDISGALGEYDYAIEGWAFGHTVLDHKDMLEMTVDLLVNNVASVLKPNGMMIFIETLGTNVDYPQAPNNVLSDFYQLLERRHGFSKEVIATDYLFPDISEAKRIMGFFFGESMKESVSEKRIKEFSGIWTKRI